jgi:hypothetical protein
MESTSFHSGRVQLWRGDCREALRELPDCSIDSCVTDPPYALGAARSFCALGPGQYDKPKPGFMGKEWDNGETAFDPEFWRDVLRVLKPGAHLLAMGGTRTYHRLACAIEDAGFEIRDMVADLVCADGHVSRFIASLSREQQCAFVKAIDESSFGGMLAWVFGAGFPKSRDPWRLEIKEKVEPALRQQGVQGEIRWK